MSSDVQISFDADTSALQGSLAVVQDAVGQLQASFADTSAISNWSQAVGASAQTAAGAVSVAAQTIQTGLTTRLDPIGASAARLFSGLISGSETFGQAFERMGDQLLSHFVGWAAEMAERWAVSELAQ
uniref:hypothetical protein n=1 Tax=Caulobacter sp. S45 TaxID=1641861 RepID=UPI001576F11B